MAKEMDLAGSLIWGKTRQSLQKFLKDSPPPQIVRIEDDFYGGIEKTRLHGGNMLIFHRVVTDKILIGTDISDKQINIDLSCPAPVYMRPLKCKFESCKAEDFKSIFPKVKYVKVKNFDSGSTTDDAQCAVNVGDLLQIMKIDKKKKTVICQDIDSKEEKVLPYKSSVVFTPLQDYRAYSLSEVVSKQGLPARVCFKATSSQAVNESALKGVADVVFHKEVTEYRVIATVVGEVGEQTRCLGLPIDLPIQCTIAERLSKDLRNYEEIVRALNQGFDFKNFVGNVNVFHDLKNIKIYEPISLPESASQTHYASSPRRPRRNAIKSPPVSPKPKNNITKTDPNGSPKSPKSPLVVPRPTSRAPNDCPAATKAVDDEPSRSLPENNASVDEDNYVEIEKIQKQDYHENKHGEKNSAGEDKDYDKESKLYVEKTTNAVKKSPPVSPKPIRKIKTSEPNGSSKDPTCLLKVPKPSYSPSAEYCEVTVAEYDEPSRCLHEESTTTDEDGYVEMAIAKHCYYEKCGYEKNSRGKAIAPGSQRNRNNGYEEVSFQPRWTAKQNHEFADPRFLLNKKCEDAKQSRPMSAEYVIPLTPVSPERTSSSDCYENMYVTWNRKPKTDGGEYENVVPQGDWEFYSKDCDITSSSDSSEYVEMTRQTVRLGIS